MQLLKYDELFIENEKTLNHKTKTHSLSTVILRIKCGKTCDLSENGFTFVYKQVNQYLIVLVVYYVKLIKLQ